MKNQEPGETPQVFESRKQDHIRLALDSRTQADGLSGFDFLELIHEALPELDFEEINTATQLLGHNFSSPLFISSMTAGHEQGELINDRLANLAATKNILFAVGSQRRELHEARQAQEWMPLRNKYPQLKMIANIGLTQVIHSPVIKIKELISNLGAVGIYIHLNPLQEVLQREGTPQFRGGLAALQRLKSELGLPVLVKEVGCGISLKTARKLESVGIDVIDVAGRGGTHWGRLEGLRDSEQGQKYLASQVFKDWGISTAESLRQILSEKRRAKIWASGGIRNGLDVAKALALGAQAVGIAAPFLKGALEPPEKLELIYEQFLFELKLALFCSGVRNLEELQSKEVSRWK